VADLGNLGYVARAAVSMSTPGVQSFNLSYAGNDL
jgi:hypothetical protein